METAETPAAEAHPPRRRVACPIPFGLALETGRMCEPRAVPLGKRCGCICPACRTPLVAKHCKSGRRAPHFAHARGADCAAGLETALHLAAKQRIADRSEFWFPALALRVEAKDALGLTHRVTKELVPAGLRVLSCVALEALLPGMRPDLAVQCGEFGEVLIKIAVTHFVDESKQAKLIAAGRAALEVDVSHLRGVDFAQLDAVLFAPSPHNRWLYQERLQRFEERVSVELRERLDRASADARTALAAARAFGKAGPSEQAPAPEQYEPVWVRELQAAARTGQQLRGFRRQSEREKVITLRRWMGVAALPAFLAARTRHAGAFGVDEPAIWQSALFLGMIDSAMRQAESRFRQDDALASLEQHFDMPAARRREDADALADYVAFLRAAGGLAAPVVGNYPIAVADAGALAAHIVASQPNTDIDRDLRWAAAGEWPAVMRASAIYAALDMPAARGHAWRTLVGLDPIFRAAPPSHFCEMAVHKLRIDQERLRDFLVRAGYLRVAAIAAPAIAVPGG